MTITSKLFVRTLVVIIGLFIFVRGLWINFFYPEPLIIIDTINALLSFIAAGLIIIVGILIGFGLFLEIIVPSIRDLWTGQKQLFKPFKINFKFKKK